MAHNGQMNGYGPPASGAQPDGIQGKKRTSMPSVNEALPFTPLASIVPFNPDVIPAPVALPPPTHHTNIQTEEEQRNTKKLLEQLSAGASNAEHASKRVQRTLQDVCKLLDPEHLTQFKFKKPKHQNVAAHQANAKVTKPKLSPFAKMVYDETDVSFRYLTPESIDEQQRARSTTAHPTPTHAKAPAQPKVPTGKVVIKQETPQYNGPQISTPSSQHSKLEAVVINPAVLTPGQRAQYEYVAEADTIAVANPTKKRAAGLANAGRSMNVDQKQKGDSASRHLQTLLHDIFEAEDQLQPDTSGVVSKHQNEFFLSSDEEDGRTPMLQPHVLAQLESAVQKVVKLGRLNAIPVDMLSRAQKLCQLSITAADNLSLHIGEEWSEQDVEEWLGRVGVAEAGVCAGRTLLRIMIGGETDKELQSEDYLREALSLFRNVIEECVVPVVEQRPSDKAKGDRIKGDKSKIEAPLDSKFAVATANRGVLQNLVFASRKSIRLLGELLVKSDVDESSVSSTEGLCKNLVFAENAGVEKEAALGIQSFEELRRCAMDVLAAIFERYEEQRQWILGEILVSLEKLPPTKQSARQYKLIDGKPIQLVSALLMRLVQTSACRSRSSTSANGRRQKSQNHDANENDSDDEDASGEEDDDVVKVSPAKQRDSMDLSAVAKPLHDAAQTHASYIIKILLERGLATSKASEEPYRKLLDIFTEDFLNVLGSCDWPAAEMLLYTMLSHMMHLCKNPKTSVPAKTLALEFLGIMGSGILELRTRTRRAARALDSSDSELSSRLVETAESLDEQDSHSSSTLTFDGPYRATLEYLQARNSGDAQLQSAYGHFLMRWAHQLYTSHEMPTESESRESHKSISSTQNKVKAILLDPLWLEENSDFGPVSTAQGRLAGLVVTMNSRFCRAFEQIFGVLLSSMSSEQSRIKSRSLKSVISLLEEDPSVLDRSNTVLSHIYRCATDSSPLVRDSALDLIAKCIVLRPALDVTVCDKVIARAYDASTGVRKRAMKLLKDIYLRNDSTTMLAAIANALLTRMHDTEESVLELARSIMEEVWFLPLQLAKAEGHGGVKAQLKYRAQASMLIRTVERDEQVVKVLESLLSDVLVKSKSAPANFRVCKKLVAVLFDAIIDNNEIPGSPSQTSILQTLAIFARTSPNLFTAPQLERLEPYTENLASSDLLVYSYIVTIFRHVIPYLDTLRPDFLEKIERSMQGSIPTLPKGELAEVAPCIWTVASLRKNIDKPLTLVVSVFTQIHKHRQLDLSTDEKGASRVIRLMDIAGQFGRACDFSDQLQLFKSKFPWFNGNAPAGLMVEILCAFSSPKLPLAVRESSIENICAVAQAWPKQFERSDVIHAFDTVFKDNIVSLELLLLQGLAGFICAQETPDTAEDAQALGGGVETGAQRIGSTYNSTDSDSASNRLAQRFLDQILRLAQASMDDVALVSTRLITSIARQGRSHPKDCCPALVALETCPNDGIAKLAFLEHRNMNGRFETIVEKEYMRAIPKAFEYQRDVVRSTKGYAGQPATAKIHYLWEVLKSGKGQVRKKFLTNFCQKLAFDLSTVDARVANDHLAFVRFCVENLAFLEYDRTDEALLVLSSLEKVFAGVGTSVAQAVESDVLRLNLEAVSALQSAALDHMETSAPVTTAVDVDPHRLLLLSVSAQILTLVWETRTFLRRLWNLQKYASKAKKPTKDQETSRPPIRSPNAASLIEDYLQRVSRVLAASATPEQQRAICASFVELISTDNEVKVGSEDDENADEANGYNTAHGSRSSKSPSVPPGMGGHGKKRKSGSVSSTPRKKSRVSITGRRRSTSVKYDEDDGEGDWE